MRPVRPVRPIALGALVTAVLGAVFAFVPSAAAWRPTGCLQPSNQVAIINNAPTTPINYAALGVTAAATWRFAGSHVNVQMVPPGTWTINSYSAFNWGNTPWDGISTWENGCVNGRYTNPTNVWLNRCYTDGHVDGARQSVLVHEIGHILGLAHNGQLQCASMPVMQSNTPDRWNRCLINTPRADDRAGVNALY